MDDEQKRSNQRRKKTAVDMINKSLRPVEQGFSALEAVYRKSKETLPWLYDYLEETVGHHIITPDTKDISGQQLGSALTANIMRRLPNISEDQLNSLLGQNDSSFLNILTKGLGINPASEKDYSVIRKKKLFKRVLIANRGEIALRVIRACRELGIETVALCSEHEKDALHVKFADKCYQLGKSKNYLDIKKIVNAAKKMEVDAIHPGYGFLSENSEFARLCEKEKIKFIGPSSYAISMLGDKVTAKAKMKEAGVPVVEGYADPLKDKEEVKEIASSIGFPVILKAAAGGGGKGMRIVRKEEDLGPAFESAKSEAANAFGNDTVYIEKYFDDPKHIEFQILADQHGNVIHLGERDCSIQRRHQKLIEEAPSPALDEDLRDRMGMSAVNAIKAIGYEGAGTVEFLLDKSGNFHFIEMNTRIQVEHGVTELITGVDLVKEQVKLAAGATLAYEQKDIKVEGWAIECRINAEDPYNDFAPSTGTVTHYLPPGGPGIKISSSCHTGYEVTPHFDSLIALLMCHAGTREEAIHRMHRALDEYLIKGVKTTIPFHRRILENRQFLKGLVTTSFIPRNKILEKLKEEAKSKKPSSIPKERRTLVVTTAVSEHVSRQQAQNYQRSSSWTRAARQDAVNDEF